MLLLAKVVVVALCLFLIGFSVEIFVKPASAERFLMALASSVRTHFAEQLLRVVIGVSLIVLAPSMRFGGIFWALGWLTVITAIALMILPWRWHQSLAQLLLPMVVRHMLVYGVLLAAFAAFVLYAVFA